MVYTIGHIGVSSWWILGIRTSVEGLSNGLN